MTTQLVAVDGSDALFGLVLRPSDDPRNPGGIVAETFGSGLSRPVAAWYLRQIARSLLADAAADGESVDVGDYIPRNHGGLGIPPTGPIENTHHD